MVSLPRLSLKPSQPRGLDLISHFLPFHWLTPYPTGKPWRPGGGRGGVGEDGGRYTCRQLARCECVCVCACVCVCVCVVRTRGKAD